MSLPQPDQPALLDVKTCRMCGLTLPRTEFYGSATNRDRLSNQCKPCDKKRAYSYQRNDPERARKVYERSIKQRFGMTSEEHASIVARHGGACAICGATEYGEGTRALHLDHDHTTGRVRGLLCARCNTWLGWYERYSAAIIDYVNGGWS